MWISFCECLIFSPPPPPKRTFKWSLFLYSVPSDFPPPLIASCSWSMAILKASILYAVSLTPVGSLRAPISSLYLYAYNFFSCSVTLIARRRRRRRQKLLQNVGNYQTTPCHIQEDAVFILCVCSPVLMVWWFQGVAYPTWFLICAVLWGHEHDGIEQL